jgi:hypothetical protein
MERSKLAQLAMCSVQFGSLLAACSMAACSMEVPADGPQETASAIEDPVGAAHPNTVSLLLNCGRNEDDLRLCADDPKLARFSAATGFAKGAKSRAISTAAHFASSMTYRREASGIFIVFASYGGRPQVIHEPIVRSTSGKLLSPVVHRHESVSDTLFREYFALEDSKLEDLKSADVAMFALKETPEQHGVRGLMDVRFADPIHYLWTYGAWVDGAMKSGALAFFSKHMTAAVAGWIHLDAGKATPYYMPSIKRIELPRNSPAIALSGTTVIEAADSGGPLYIPVDRADKKGKDMLVLGLSAAIEAISVEYIQAAVEWKKRSESDSNQEPEIKEFLADPDVKKAIELVTSMEKDFPTFLQAIKDVPEAEVTPDLHLTFTLFTRLDGRMNDPNSMRAWAERTIKKIDG